MQKKISSTVTGFAVTTLRARPNSSLVGAIALLGGLALLSPAPVRAQELTCNESAVANFKPDANTSVLLVRQFAAGEPLVLGDQPTAEAPVAGADICLVKLNVGPGNPGPAGAPSTSTGIGIEVWLPSKEEWNNRIQFSGGSGWQGGDHGNPQRIATFSRSSGSPAVAAAEGWVSATTDTGHAITGTGAFAINPDGSINKVLWNDFSERGIHEMALKTKLLTTAFYGRPAERSYYNGFSTGGRQGLKFAQRFPDVFDGILSGAPAIN